METSCAWKSNWDETRRHFIDWWRHEGLLLGMWGAPPARRPRADLPVPPPPASVEAAYTDAALRAQWNHYRLAQRAYPADTLPIAETHLGPGSLALFLGAEPGFSPETVWFHSIWKDREDLESVPPLAFDPSNRWWQLTEETTRASLALSRGQYLVECPDLVENIDILAALRDPQTLLIDMLERPDWIKQKVDESTRPGSPPTSACATSSNWRTAVRVSAPSACGAPARRPRCSATRRR